MEVRTAFSVDVTRSRTFPALRRLCCLLHSEIVGAELFELEDLGAARARFEELRPGATVEGSDRALARFEEPSDESGGVK